MEKCYREECLKSRSDLEYIKYRALVELDILSVFIRNSSTDEMRYEWQHIASFVASSLRSVGALTREQYDKWVIKHLPKTMQL